MADYRRPTIENRANPLWDVLAVFTIFCSLGFPGNYEYLFGSIIKTMMEYAVFMLQIAVMLMSSGDTVLEVQVLNFRPKYASIYLMLICWFTTSMIVTRYPQMQFISCTRFTVTALFALWLVERYSTERIFEMTYYAQVMFIAVTLFALLIMPGRSFSTEAGSRTFCGIFTTKNPCATELSFGLTMQLAWFKHLRQNEQRLPRFFLGMLMIQVILLLMTKGTGAIFCAILPLAYLYFTEFFGLNHLRLPLGIIYVAASVLFIVFALSILPLFEPFLTMIGKDVTLTGRTPMWRQFIDVMSNHNTFMGFGFSTFWKDSKAVYLFHQGFSKGSWGNTMTYGAHNTILELWLDVGLFGLATYFGMLIISMSGMSRVREIQYDFCMVFIFWLMTKGFTERSYIPFNYSTLFLFLAVGIASNKLQPETEQTAVPVRRRAVYEGRAVYESAHD